MRDLSFKAILLVTFSTSINPDNGVDHAVNVARCRAFCLFKMNIVEVTEILCQTSLNCSQCWRTCALLSSDFPCKKRDCGPGCLEACHFFSQNVSQESSLWHVKHEEFHTRGDFTIFWLPSRSWPPSVSIVMVGTSLLYQTVKSTFTLPSGTDLMTVWVLEISWYGLSRVLGPPQIIHTQSLRVIESLGLEVKVSSKKPSPNYISMISPWRLQLISMRHQPPLVSAHVSWQPQQLEAADQLTYLVTWEVVDGTLRGNLITNTTTDYISLLPNITYKMQVLLFPSLDWRSEPFLLNTCLSSSSSLSPKTRPVSCSQVKETAWVNLSGLPSTVLILWGIFIFSCIIRWQYCLPLPHLKEFTAKSYPAKDTLAVFVKSER